VKTKTTTVWTAERDQQILQWRLNGLSCSEMASNLGPGISRNAVIGRLNRLQAPRMRDLAPSRPTTPAIKLRPMLLEPMQKRRPATVKIAPTVVKASTNEAGRPWLTRRASECAWPVSGSGADTHYCCEPAKDGSSYCEHHHARGHTKAA
jgi:GcrA cell cycle regulator